MRIVNCFLFGIVLACVSSFVSADMRSDWRTMAYSLTLSGDLDGSDTWYTLSEDPISLSAVNDRTSGLLNFTTLDAGSNCSASSVSNQIVVNADEGAIVNIESSQSTDTSEITAQCNNFDTQIN